MHSRRLLVLFSALALLAPAAPAAAQSVPLPREAQIGPRPFYLVDNVEALGATRLLMGVPLYALVLVFSWLVVRAVYPSSSRSGE